MNKLKNIHFYVDLMDQGSDLAHIADKSDDQGLQKWTVIHKRARLLHGNMSCGPKRGDFWDYSSERQKTNNRKRCRTESSRLCTAITTQPDPNVGSGEITMAALQRRIGPLPTGTTWPRGIRPSRAILAIAAVTTHKAAHGRNLYRHMRSTSTCSLSKWKITPGAGSEQDLDNLCTHGIKLSFPPDFTPSLFWT